MAAVVFRVVSKAAVGAGAVYVTCDQGVWSNNRSGTEALKKVKGTVLPAANDYVQQIPTTVDVNNTLRNGWNSGVKMAFSGLSAAPDTTGEFTKRAVISSTNFVKQSVN